MTEFDNFGAFGAHLLRTAAAGAAIEKVILKKAAEIIQKDAKARIGTYQDGMGPFPAWANLAESTVDDRIRKGFAPEDPLLRTGEMRNSIGVLIAGNEAIIGTPDAVALHHEMGTSRMPPRPFLGPAAMHSKEAVEKMAPAVVLAWIGRV